MARMQRGRLAHTLLLSALLAPAPVLSEAQQSSPQALRAGPRTPDDAAGAVPPSDAPQEEEEEEEEEEKYLRAFAAYRQRFDKEYSEEEEPRRFAAFKHSYDVVRAHNAKGGLFTLEVNALADLSTAEFRAMYGLQDVEVPEEVRQMLPLLGTHQPRGNATRPQRVDWRERGAVSPVKNQGQCGSCWAFATTGALEGAWAIATGQHPELSEQQIIDCASNGRFGNKGCTGGNMQSAVAYAMTTALCNEASYPYAMKQQQCRGGSKCVQGLPMYAVTGYRYVRFEEDDEALLQAVAQQPVAAMMDAEPAVFQLYRGGVFSAPCPDKIDHAVLMVGYGSDNGVDYYLLKNSWGPSWGEQGYFRLKRGLPGTGECGIRFGPGYPVVDGSRAQPLNLMPSIIAGLVVLGTMMLFALYCYADRVLACCCRRRTVAPSSTLTPARTPFTARSGEQGPAGGTRGGQVSR